MGLPEFSLTVYPVAKGCLMATDDWGYKGREDSAVSCKGTLLQSQVRKRAPFSFVRDWSLLLLGVGAEGTEMEHENIYNY